MFGSTPTSTSHIAKIHLYASSVSVLLVVLVHVFLPSTQMGKVPSNNAEGITEFSPQLSNVNQTLARHSIESWFHQKFQVPKMEVLNLIRLFWGCVFPYISLTYSLYR